ncbi:nuclear transport factor 2 family protein [Frateuria soli]|uniref:nuclear transport factor 2 family protein n=1 Tax=Frateuria soli TaxID=1542730 RepID=UPI001E4DBBE8|nr:nuclear transport factor 2 family protein [Frateuria soli]UGB36864.1 nuclear transport factor 2 family protein [Frateuria soli]
MTPVSFRTLLMPCALALAASLPQAAAAQTAAASAASGTAATETPATPTARPADVASIDAILKAAYDVISGPKGHRRDWDRLRSLFAPGARLIPTHTSKDGVTSARVLNVDEFIRFASDPDLQKNGFFEDELHRTVQRFGNIAQVFSTYETRHEAAGKPFQRGINSIQLLFDGHRWWIMTIYWQGERPDLRIPKQYGG